MVNLTINVILTLLEMLPSLDNYVTFGSEVIKQNVEYQKMFCDISFTIFARASEAGEQDLVRACQLFESILLNLRSTIDSYIPSIVSVVLPFTLGKEAKTASFKVHSIEVILNCILYNPLMALSLLQQSGKTQEFFDAWLDNLADFVRVHDIRLSVCAFSSLLEVPDLEPYYGKFVIGILGLLEEFPEAMVERIRIGKMMKGEGSDIDEDEDFDFGDEDDDLEDGGIDVEENGDEDTQTVDQLQSDIAKAGFEIDTDAAGEESDDEYDYGNGGLEEDPFFETVLDSIDIVARVKGVLASLSPGIQAAIAAGLSAEQQASLHKILV